MESKRGSDRGNCTRHGFVERYVVFKLCKESPANNVCYLDKSCLPQSSCINAGMFGSEMTGF